MGSSIAAVCLSSGLSAAFLSILRLLGVRICLNDLLHSYRLDSDTLDSESLRGLGDHSASAAHSCLDSLRTRSAHTLASGVASLKHGRTFFLHTCCMFLWCK